MSPLFTQEAARQERVMKAQEPGTGMGKVVGSWVSWFRRTGKKSEAAGAMARAYCLSH